ncbi:MAG: hypothetical protein ACLQGU_19730 [bacterium]
MATVEDRVKEFLEVWANRKSGESPAPDLTEGNHNHYLNICGPIGGVKR